MFRKLRISVVLCLSFGALIVPAAEAAPEFTVFNASTLEHESESSIHAALAETPEGSLVHKFSAGSGGAAVECASATFTATATESASSTQAVSPEYSECEAIFGETTHVQMNGCEYLFHLESEPAELEYSGTVDLICPGSEGPTVTTTTAEGLPKCTLHLQPNQEGLNTLTAREAEGQMEVEANLAEIAYVSTGGFFNCGVTNGEHTNGTYEGNTTVSAAVGEEAMVLQALPSRLESAPGVLKIEKNVKNEGTITLSTKSKNELVVKSQVTSTVYKIKKDGDKCFQKKVPCTIEIECLVEGQFAPFTSTALDMTTKLYHPATTKVECV